MSLQDALQTYPLLDEDTQGMAAIPGGPKLPRTPQGPQSVGARSGMRTPAPSPDQAAAASHDSPQLSFAPGSQACLLKVTTPGMLLQWMTWRNRLGYNEVNSPCCDGSPMHILGCCKAFLFADA